MVTELLLYAAFLVGWVLLFVSLAYLALVLEHALRALTCVLDGRGYACPTHVSLTLWVLVLDIHLSTLV